MLLFIAYRILFHILCLKYTEKNGSLQITRFIQVLFCNITKVTYVHLYQKKYFKAGRNIYL